MMIVLVQGKTVRLADCNLHLITNLWFYQGTGVASTTIDMQIDNDQSPSFHAFIINKAKAQALHMRCLM